MAATNIAPAAVNPGKDDLDASGSRAAASRRRRDLLEVSGAYGLIALAVWTPLPYQRWLSLAGLTWVIATTWLSFDGWRETGFRVARFWRAWWVVAAALALAAASAVLAYRLQTLHAPNSPGMFVQRFWAYAIWAFLQEFLLLNYFLLRLMRLMPSPQVAAMTATALFAAMHLPNPVLAPLTAIWGYVACWVFLRYRNIYLPALGHAILGISIAITVPGTVDHNMRVGLGYLTYRPHLHRHPNPGALSGAKSTIPYLR